MTLRMGERKWRMVILCAVVLLGALCLYAVVRTADLTDGTPVNIIDSMDRIGNSAGEITVGTEVTQPFVSAQPFSYFSFCWGTWGRANECRINVSLRTAGSRETLWSSYLDMRDVVDSSKPKISLEKAFPAGSYEFVLDTADGVAGNTVTVYLAEANESIENARVNGTPLSNPIAFSVGGYEKPATSLPIMLFCGFIIALSVFAVGVLLFQKQEAFVPRWQDYAIFGAIALLTCLFFSQSWDISITMMQAKDLISVTRQGDFFAFYNRVADRVRDIGYFGTPGVNSEHAVYSILLYLVTAICIIPLYGIEKLFSLSISNDVYLVYIQLVLLAVVLLSARFFIRFCLKAGMTAKRARIAGFLFVSSPILLFASVGFAQLDIFIVLLILIALSFYMDKRLYAFSCVMSVAIAAKALPVLIFIPLLLLVEKRVWRILIHLCIGVAATVLTKLPFLGDYGYIAGQALKWNGYGFINWMFVASVQTGLGSLPVFLVCITVICVYAYQKKAPEGRIKLAQYAMLLYAAAIFSFFALVTFHPQWACLLAPAVAFIVATLADRKVAMFISTAMSVAYLARIDIIHFIEYVTEGRLLPLLTGKPFGPCISTVLRRSNDLVLVTQACNAVWFSMLACMFAVYCQSIRRADCLQSEDTSVSRSAVYVRMGVLLAYDLLSVLAYWYFV